MSTDKREPGPWEPVRDTGYNAHARPWVLRRANGAWAGGVEVMKTASFNVRRFAKEAAAKMAADDANGRQT